MKKEIPSLSKIAEGIEDPSFQRLYWFESRNFKAKYLMEDVNLYFTACFLSYATTVVISIVAALKCYRTGLKFPFALAQAQLWKPYRYFLIPALIAILLGTVVPLPVGWDDSGFRGNPFENPIYLPIYSTIFFGFLQVVGAAGALWLGRERARLSLVRKRATGPTVDVSLQRGQSDI